MFTFAADGPTPAFYHDVEYNARKGYSPHYDTGYDGVLNYKSWHGSAKENTYHDVVIQYGPRPSTDLPCCPATYPRLVTSKWASRFPGFRMIRFVSLELVWVVRTETVKPFAELF